MNVDELFRQRDYGIIANLGLHDLEAYVVCMQGDGPEHWEVWPRADYERLTAVGLPDDLNERDDAMADVWQALAATDVSDSRAGRKAVAQAAACYDFRAVP